MKRSPLSRQTPLHRGAGPKRKSKVKARNPKRRASEFARCYHSAERVAFVRALPCAACRAPQTFSLNAHVSGEGMGRKAPYTKILPLCFTCHGLQHLWGSRTFAERYEIDLDAAAAECEAAWQAHCDRQARSRAPGAGT